MSDNKNDSIPDPHGSGTANENEQENHNPETEEDTASGGPADPPDND